MHNPKRRTRYYAAVTPKSTDKIPPMPCTKLRCGLLLLAMQAVLALLLLSALPIRAAEDSSADNNKGGASSIIKSNSKIKSCKGLWRPDTLVGKCFGLTDSEKLESEGYKKFPIASADDCRKLCCIMGDKCTTWQFQTSSNVCQVGPVVRLGFEGCDSKVLGGEHCGNWCEPHAPSKWNGRRVVSRSNEKPGECTWGEELPSQCFGFGPERLKDSKTKEKHTTDSCAEACCRDPTCHAWQEVPGRGCFYGDSNHCEKYLGSYEGGRKCIQGHCGGMEKDILEPWLKKHGDREAAKEEKKEAS